jgi:hypothetical protein
MSDEWILARRTDMSKLMLNDYAAMELDDTTLSGVAAGVPGNGLALGHRRGNINVAPQLNLSLAVGINIVNIWGSYNTVDASNVITTWQGNS